MLFEHRDGRLEVWTPWRPVDGTYKIDGREFTVSGLGRAVTRLSADAIDALDGAVARGEAQFEPSEDEESYFASVREHIRETVPGIADATFVRMMSDQEYAQMDRTFRDAWRASGDRIEVDMALAKAVQEARLASARAPLLARLDIEYQRADGRERAEINAKKAALLASVLEVRAARTPDELKMAGMDVIAEVAEVVRGGRA